MTLQQTQTQHLSLVVIGASGDLAVKKIFPALFSLYCRNLLPDSFCCYGFARSEMSEEDFRKLLQSHLTCRYTPGECECKKLIDEFLTHCHYISGHYDSMDSFRKLKSVLEKHEIPETLITRLFYFSIPPFLFMPVAHSLAQANLTSDIPEKRLCRVVIEKPFGRDLPSSDKLTRGLAQVLSEEQTYRIDHYLGKEVIQNLMALRFANLIFEPLWNRSNIAHISITWMEDIGVEGRGGYFDSYGILRDVMQNHLLQILALVAMEEPISLNPEYIRDEKVKVLRSVAPVTLNDIVVGQYTKAMYNGSMRKGYLEETGIPSDSITPTYGA
ncbi:MAG: glucose-6-phosphate dehydrogenase (NADP(+)), partial [Candidatus Hydrogenedentes bacterium]|nr:glucose-6-phosphate dehydrogenase (NADP(+)) [Candidatus Hydrogenedentota bacterium]